MSSTHTTPSEQRSRAAFDVGFNEALVDAHDRAVAAVADEPEDLYIFHDPRVRRVLTYVVLGLIALTAVVGIALFVEWLQVGRHEVSAAAPLAAEPIGAEPSGSSIPGGLLRLGIGFLVASGLAGAVAMQIVRPGRA